MVMVPPNIVNVHKPGSPRTPGQRRISNYRYVEPSVDIGVTERT